MTGTAGFSLVAQPPQAQIDEARIEQIITLGIDVIQAIPGGLAAVN